MSNSVTSLLKFLLPAFGDTNWQDEMYGNFRTIDSLLGGLVGLSQWQGAWLNSTAYVVGDHVVDGIAGGLFVCAVAHTSHASDSFATDRASNPTYWTAVAFVANSPAISVVSNTSLSAENAYTFVPSTTGIDLFVFAGLTYSGLSSTQFAFATDTSPFTYNNSWGYERLTGAAVRSAASGVTDIPFHSTAWATDGDLCGFFLMPSLASATSRGRFFGLVTGKPNGATLANVWVSAHQQTAAAITSAKFSADSAGSTTMTGTISHLRIRTS